MGHSAVNSQRERAQPMRILIFIGLLLSLSACGGGKDTIVFDTTVGPKTEDQEDRLGDSLKGDSANANHSGSAVVGDNMTAD